MKSRKQVVILGGGFGGVYTAMNLRKSLRASDKLDIVLITRENYLVFQPLLPEVIAGSIDLIHCITPIRRLCPDIRLITREINQIDLKRRKITTVHGVRPQPLEIEFDYLVIALGRGHDFSSMPGLREHAFTFKNMADGLILRNHILHSLEEADIEMDPQLRRELLTFVVAGGGFSGVEVAAQIHDLFHNIRSNYPSLKDETVRVVLVHSGERILPELNDALGNYAGNILRRRGLRLLLNERVERAAVDSVYLQSGLRIPARTLVSTVPSTPNPLLNMLECEIENGRVATQATLAVKGAENVWALGDCALIRDEDGMVSPPTAQFAVRQARTVAANILLTHREKTGREHFSFSGLGKIGSLGRRSAVAEIFGLKISGIIAWFLWRTIYWAKMPGLDRKIRVGIDWALNMLLPGDTVQMKIADREKIAMEHFEAGQFVFRKGDLGDKMYVILDGEVEVIAGDGEQEKCLAVLGKDCHFGEMALWNGEPRMASVRTRTPVNLMTVSSQDFQLLLNHIPAVRDAFTAEMDRRQRENLLQNETSIPRGQ